MEMLPSQSSDNVWILEFIALIFLGSSDDRLRKPPRPSIMPPRCWSGQKRVLVETPRGTSTRRGRQRRKPCDDERPHRHGCRLAAVPSMLIDAH